MSLPDRTRICIVGAGAAGLWAAQACGKFGIPALLLEKTKRTGSKVLSSGGSRCNLTTSLKADAAARWFGEGHNFVRPAFRNLTPQEVRTRFETMGVATKEEEQFEKIFPASDSALEVRNALETAAKRAGSQIVLGASVRTIAPDSAGWRVESSKGTTWCESLLVCTGGKSYPKVGTTGDAYPWFRKLGLKVVDPVPALVPLTSPAEWVHRLSGIAIEGELRIGKHRRRRPVLFTHRGISGPGSMDLSEQVTRGQQRLAHLDLLPDVSWETLRQQLVDGAAQSGSPRLGSLLPLPKRLVEAVAQLAGLTEANPRLNQINKSSRHRLVETLKALPIPVTGSLGFAKAEVTAGGLALHEVNRLTMEVKKHPGLYVFGEALNLQGPIGGFNFQAAFSTAELAAKAACSTHSEDPSP